LLFQRFLQPNYFLRNTFYSNITLVFNVKYEVSFHSSCRLLKPIVFITQNIRFFVSKHKNQQKGFEILYQYNFEIFGVNYLMIMNFCVAWNQFYKISRHKHIHRGVSRRNREERKYRFWLQKGVKFWIRPHFFHQQDKKLHIIPFSNVFLTYFFNVRSHGFDGLFGAFDVACGW